MLVCEAVVVGCSVWGGGKGLRVGVVYFCLSLTHGPADVPPPPSPGLLPTPLRRRRARRPCCKPRNEGRYEVTS